VLLCSSAHAKFNLRWWASFLRRLKIPSKEGAIVLLTADISHTTAWTFLFACKELFTSFAFPSHAYFSLESSYPTRYIQQRHPSFHV
jgi:hypothetical protein